MCMHGVHVNGTANEIICIKGKKYINRDKTVISMQEFMKLFCKNILT